MSVGFKELFIKLMENDFNVKSFVEAEKAMKPADREKKSYSEIELSVLRGVAIVEGAEKFADWFGASETDSEPKEVQEVEK